MPSSTEASSTPPSEDTSVSSAATPEIKTAAAVDGQTPSDVSKLKTFLMILRRFIGVSDIAAVRFSLPAQLLEPIPNLEYWHYLDRPETFAAVGESDDPIERMLACLRFWFTKDLKYVKGKACKPYNSALGEFFRCSWDAEGSAKEDGKPVKVNYMTEQTSHHPPVSAFIYDCPDKGISAIGYDQLSAKFTGTAVKVIPGQYNKGIFLKVHSRDGEEYRFTHPAGYLGGFMRGTINVSVQDTCYVSCAKTGLKTILHYLDESYFSKVQNKVEGIIYRPADFEKDRCSRLKDVPKDQIIGRFEGCYMDKIYFSKGPTEFKKVSSSDKTLFTDLNPLFPVPKYCPPMDQQLPNESRRFWSEVTDLITSKQYSEATTRKTQLEEKQRERATQRKSKGKDWQPRFFTTPIEEDGRPILSEDGMKAINGLQAGDYHLETPEEYGAL